MAPIRSDDESDVSGSSVSASEAEASVAQNQALRNGALEEEDDEEEFHTEDSEGSEDGIAAECDPDIAGTTNAPNIPLLPESLLKALPSAARLAPSLAKIPWDQLTPKQKKARRNNSREMKKRTYDRLLAEAKESGVLEAGKAAQRKRGVVPRVKKDRVRSGRVEKKEAAKVKVSGRQRLMEDRKKAVKAAAGGEKGRVRKRARTGTKSKR